MEKKILEEIKTASEGYAEDLQRLYEQKPNCPKFWRTEKILSYVEEHIGREKTLLDVGCGPGLISREFAEKLGFHCSGVDFSPKEIEIAQQLLDKGDLQDGHVQLFVDDLFKPGQEWGEKSYDVVLSIDVLGSYQKRSQKKEFISQLLEFTHLESHVVMTALCCIDEKFAEKHRDGEVIRYEHEGNVVGVPLYHESFDWYKRSMESLVGKERVYIHQLDEESVLIHLF